MTPEIGSENSQCTNLDNWIVLSEFDGDGELNLDCPECGNEADCPTHGYAVILASMGLTLFPSPSSPANDDFLPDKLKCPDCGTVFQSKSN